jgi:hypothetical protein
MSTRALALASVLAASAALCEAANATPRAVPSGAPAEPAKENSSERLPAGENTPPPQTQPPSQEPKP